MRTRSRFAALSGWLRIRPVSVTLALAVAFAVYGFVSVWSGMHKLSDAEVATALERAGGSPQIDVRFVLRFQPEQFHFGVFQNAGRMVGVEDREVLVRAIPIETARDLAGRYWIADVVPMEAP